MVQSCVVVGCTNRWKKGSTISWHRIPSEKDPERRKRWLVAINRKGWAPSSQDCVCGKHFIKGSASLQKEDPDYAPTIELGYTLQTASTPQTKLGRYARASKRGSAKKEAEQDENNRHIAASILMDLSSTFNKDDSLMLEADAEMSPPRSSNQQDVDENLLEDLAKMKLEKQEMMRELARLQTESSVLKNEIKEKTFGAASLMQKKSDKQLSFYTGLPNLNTFIWILSYLQFCIPCFLSISQEDVVLLVLMKLKLNLQNLDLAMRFNISQTTVSDVLNKCLPVFASKLKFLIHWPEKDDVLRTLPALFKPKYKNTHTIIDCTEIFIDRPGNLTARASTWSNYKHNNTLKYLVAITPLGAISFISKAFGGRTSDKVVTQRSGFLELLEYGDVILADRGFLIDEEIALRNCFLAIPSFT